MNYYLMDGATQKGPFPTEQLVGQGLRADSLVWAEGMPQWRRADQVPELRLLLNLPPISAPPGPVPPAHAAYPPPGYAGQPPMAGVYGPGFLPAEVANKKLAAGLCAIFFGTFGVHKFVLGMNSPGVIMLLIACTCVGAPIMHVIGWIEGIIYLTKTDQEFYQLYMVEKKQWF